MMDYTYTSTTTTTTTAPSVATAEGITNSTSPQPQVLPFPTTLQFGFLGNEPVAGNITNEQNYSPPTYQLITTSPQSTSSSYLDAPPPFVYSTTNSSSSSSSSTTQLAGFPSPYISTHFTPIYHSGLLIPLNYRAGEDLPNPLLNLSSLKVNYIGSDKESDRFLTSTTYFMFRFTLRDQHEHRVRLSHETMKRSHKLLDVFSKHLKIPSFPSNILVNDDKVSKKLLEYLDELVQIPDCWILREYLQLYSFPKLMEEELYQESSELVERRDAAVQSQLQLLSSFYQNSLLSSSTSSTTSTGATATSTSTTSTTSTSITATPLSFFYGIPFTFQFNSKGVTVIGPKKQKWFTAKVKSPNQPYHSSIKYKNPEGEICMLINETRETEQWNIKVLSDLFFICKGEQKKRGSFTAHMLRASIMYQLILDYVGAPCTITVEHSLRIRSKSNNKEKKEVVALVYLNEVKGKKTRIMTMTYNFTTSSTIDKMHVMIEPYVDLSLFIPFVFLYQRFSATAMST